MRLSTAASDRPLVFAYESESQRREGAARLKAVLQRRITRRVRVEFLANISTCCVFSEGYPVSVENRCLSRLSGIGSRSLNNSSPVSINTDDEYDPRSVPLIRFTVRRARAKGAESKGTTFVSLGF